MASTKFDTDVMRVALTLAERGLGQTSPNPSVGCVIEKHGVIIGRGWTQPGGRPHAETVALAQAGSDAEGATAYVTLEPCAHHGQTPPCAQALIDAGIVRVVAATGDPDPRVAGKGLSMLQDAGIEVTTGVLKETADALNAGFFLRIQEKRPLFTLKLATSADGRIALETGESKWITGREARRFGHMLRANHDAILIGIGTALADDPSLDCRIAGLEDRSPSRIVLDTDLRLPVTSKLVATSGGVDTIVLHAEGPGDRVKALEAAGVQVIKLAAKHSVEAVAAKLADLGFTRVLVEGGGKVHAAFLEVGYADRIMHFSAAKLIGGDGISAIAPLGLAALGDAPHFMLERISRLGPDMLASYVKAE